MQTAPGTALVDAKHSTARDAPALPVVSKGGAADRLRRSLEHAAAPRRRASGRPERLVGARCQASRLLSRSRRSSSAVTGTGPNQRRLRSLEGRYQKTARKSQNSRPDSRIDIGSVRIHASRRLRTVAHWSPEPLAAMVPATPEDNTCVVLTGSPSTSATPIVVIATS